MKDQKQSHSQKTNIIKNAMERRLRAFGHIEYRKTIREQLVVDALYYYLLGNSPFTACNRAWIDNLHSLSPLKQKTTSHKANTQDVVQDLINKLKQATPALQAC